MTRIALLRHFPTAWNEAGRFQGQTDIPLTRAAAKALETLSIPAPWDRARLISSPMLRAAETAEILARGRPVELDARLIEIAFGDWEGQRGADLIADPGSGYGHVEDAGWHLRPPGGETSWEVWERVRPALAEIARDGRPALLICHRALMRVVMARAWDWDFDRPEPFRIKRGRLYPLTLGTDGAPGAPEEPLKLAGLA